ncbi:MAG: nadE [Solirubrobacterales bacterium]|nr:nadE [Solirubrobacterales bacterium]
MSPTRWDKRIRLADPAATAAELAQKLRARSVEWRRRGIVVGVSGGVDSAVTLALAAKALGARQVLAVLLPDRDSDPLSAELGALAASRLGIDVAVHEITPVLAALGAYADRDAAAADVFEDYDPQRDRIRTEYLSDLDHRDAVARFCLTRVAADGAQETRYMRPNPYLRIVAATNLKQRTRMAVLYHEAEARNWLVAGTANRLEVEQGFFVKHGDGAADAFPLSGLFKSQVYELAAHLEVPGEIVARPPTTDTYSADQTQEQFFYGLPVRETDLMWAAYLAGDSVAEIAIETGVEEGVVQRLQAAFRRRVELADHLREAPISPSVAS